MTRKKVNLAYITKDSARKTTFKKRKKGLMKKVHELSTLCEIDACAIIFSPYTSEPDVWPSSLGAQRVIARFRKMPELEQSKKMVTQESFTRERLNKAEEQLRKLEKENRYKELTNVMHWCLSGGSLQGLCSADLGDLSCLVKQSLRSIERRMEFLKKQRGHGN